MPKAENICPRLVTFKVGKVGVGSQLCNHRVRLELPRDLSEVIYLSHSLWGNQAPGSSSLLSLCHIFLSGVKGQFVVRPEIRCQPCTLVAVCFQAALSVGLVYLLEEGKNKVTHFIGLAWGLTMIMHLKCWSVFKRVREGASGYNVQGPRFRPLVPSCRAKASHVVKQDCR